MSDLTDMTNHRLVDEYWLRRRGFVNASKALAPGKVSSEAETRVFLAAAGLYGDVRDELRERGFSYPERGTCRTCDIEIHERLSADGIPYWAPTGEEYSPCEDENGNPAPHAPERGSTRV